MKKERIEELREKLQLTLSGEWGTSLLIKDREIIDLLALLDEKYISTNVENITRTEPEKPVPLAAGSVEISGVDFTKPGTMFVVHPVVEEEK